MSVLIGFFIGVVVGVVTHAIAIKGLKLDYDTAALLAIFAGAVAWWFFYKSAERRGW
jgi:galactitol-specific phosphotransferase system IIC component